LRLRRLGWKSRCTCERERGTFEVKGRIPGEFALFIVR
jgi:hypothetical protein